MNPILALATAAILVFAVPSAARAIGIEAPPRAVVELYTSQACASCPPADEKLLELAQDPGILALTLPVDYWDYLGWADTLAHPDHTARQRAYAEARGDRKVFTPQMVVNGTLACIGSKRNEVAQTIAAAEPRGGALPVPVSVSVSGGQAQIRIGDGAAAQAPSRAPAQVWLMAVMAQADVEIGRGENAGRHARYVNVVRAMAEVGAWDGAESRLTVPLSGRGDFHVVLVQESVDGKPGRILGAARSDAAR